MTTITTVDARNKFSSLINRVAFGKERVVLTRRGEQVAVLISIEDFDFLTEFENHIDLNVVRKAMKESGRISWNKIKKDLGL